MLGPAEGLGYPQGRNPFLSRAGFDGELVGKIVLDTFLGRNPFLSRAGFDQEVPMNRVEVKLSRNPFLSRAGFDRFEWV